MYYNYGYGNYASSPAEEDFFLTTGIMGIVIIIISIIVLIWIALKFTDLANDKGYNYGHVKIFILCFLFNIIGYLYVIALPDLRLQKQNEQIIELLTSIDKKQGTSSDNQSITQKAQGDV